MDSIQKKKQLDDEQKINRYISMSNELARKAVFNLTRNQFNILFFLMSKISRDDDIDRWYKVTIQELCTSLYLKIDGTGSYYKRIKEDLQYLRNAEWVKTTSGEALTAWVQNADITDKIRIDKNGKMIQNVQLVLDEQNDDNENQTYKKHIWSGNIHYRFDAYIAQYLFHLTGNFTLIERDQLVSFVKPHSIRLYILLKSYVYKEKIDKNEPIFVKKDLMELKRVMTIKNNKKKNTTADSQLRYFIRDTINPSIEEINTKSSEFHVEIKTEKGDYTRVHTNIMFILTKAGYAQQESARKNLENLKNRMKGSLDLEVS